MKITVEIPDTTQCMTMSYVYRIDDDQLAIATQALDTLDIEEREVKNES